MLINDLIVFHKEKLGNWNLIFKHIKKETISLVCAVIIMAIGAVIGIVFKLLWTTVVFFVIYVLLLFYINKRMKKIIYEKHSIKIRRGLGWELITSYKAKQIKIFLKERDSLNDDKVRNYKEFVEKEAENVKQSNYIIFGVPGLFLAIGIPVWNQFNSWYFNNVISGAQEGLVYTVIVSVGILMVSFIIGTILNFIREISETRYRRIKNLADLLELVYLSIEEPILDEKINKNL